MYFVFVDLLGLILYEVYQDTIYFLSCKYSFFVHWNSFWYRRNKISNIFHYTICFFYKNEDDFPVIEDIDSRSSFTLSGSNNTKSNEVSTQMSMVSYNLPMQLVCIPFKEERHIVLSLISFYFCCNHAEPFLSPRQRSCKGI